jgi:2-polyprenyl-3-methyl-5-hydroxy-6-metoxy-1,4-benzoquinol methylase
MEKLKIENDKCAEFWIDPNKTIEELRLSILSGYKNNKWFGSHELVFDIDLSRLAILDFGCGLGRNIDVLKTETNFVDGYDFPVMIDAIDEGTKLKYSTLYTPAEWSDTLKYKKYDLIFCSLVLQHLSEETLIMYLEQFVNMTNSLYLVSRWYIDDNHKLLIPILAKYFDIKESFIYHSDHSKMLSLIGPPDNQCHFEAILTSKK